MTLVCDALWAFERGRGRHGWTPKQERRNRERNRNEQEDPGAHEHSGSGEDEQPEDDEPHEGERLVRIGHSSTF